MTLVSTLFWQQQGQQQGQQQQGQPTLQQLKQQQAQQQGIAGQAGVRLVRRVACLTQRGWLRYIPPPLGATPRATCITALAWSKSHPAVVICLLDTHTHTGLAGLGGPARHMLQPDDPAEPLLHMLPGCKNRRKSSIFALYGGPLRESR
jgi:hypothetical protein